METCPKGVFSEGNEISKKGFIIPVIKNIDNCTTIKHMKKGDKKGCGLCMLSCPDQAIEVSTGGNFDD